MSTSQHQRIQGQSQRQPSGKENAEKKKFSVRGLGGGHVAKTSMVWDFDYARPVAYKAVSYGEELLEEAAANFLRENSDGRTPSTSSGTRQVDEDQDPCSTLDYHHPSRKTCTDLSKPQFHSSKLYVDEIDKVVNSLKELPTSIETTIRRDKRFEPQIYDAATKHLNAHPKSKTLKNVISNSATPDQISRVESKKLENIKALQPPSRSRDPEPNIADYNETSYKRIKPPSVPPSEIPEQGVSLELEDPNFLIENELRFIEKGNKL